MKMFGTLVWVTCVFSSVSYGAEDHKVQAFKTWKQQQETEAQNRVVRLSNNLLLLKSERYNPKNVLPEVAAASKEEDDIPLGPEQATEKVAENEKELEEALERLEFVKDLTLNDYFSVYLKQYKNQPLILQEVAKSMSEGEVADVLKAILSLRFGEEDQLPTIKKDGAVVSEAPQKEDPAQL